MKKSAVGAAFLSPALCLSLLLLSPAPSAQAIAPTIPAAVTAWTTSDLTSQQWHLADIHAQQAWTVTKGAGQVIAVIDTGADATRPDLAGQLVNGLDIAPDFSGSVPDAVVTVPVPAAQSTDWYGHGTHVTGILVGNDNSSGIVGVAPQAKVMPIILEDGASDLGFANQVNAGLHWAADHGATVVNMSLGISALERNGVVTNPDEKTLAKIKDIICQGVTYADTHNVLVVSAAGNSGELGSGGNPQSLPGSCPGAVSVAALSNTHQRTYWSSMDQTVAISAPGEDILSTVPTKNAQLSSPLGIEEMSGTSMASPVVAGVAALTRAAFPFETTSQIRDRLNNAATDLGAPGWDPLYGYGEVNAAAAVGASAHIVTPEPVQPKLLMTSRPSHSASASEQTVIWTPPAYPVTNYTLTDYRKNAAPITTVIPGTEVRAIGLVKSGDWVTLVAHAIVDGNPVDINSVPQYAYSIFSANPIKSWKVARDKKNPQKLTITVTPGPDWSDFATTETVMVGDQTDTLTHVTFNASVAHPNLPTTIHLTVPAIALNEDSQISFALGNIFWESRNMKALHPLLVRQASRVHKKVAVMGTLSDSSLGIMPTSINDPYGSLCGETECLGDLVKITVSAKGMKTRVFQTKVSNGQFTAWGSLPAKIRTVKVISTLYHGKHHYTSAPIYLPVA